MNTDPVRLFINAWKQVSRGLPSPKFDEADGLACCFGNVPNLLLNLWIQAQPATTAIQLETLLAVAKEKAATSNNPVGGILREDWLPTRWEDLTSRYGYAPMLPMTSMEAEDVARDGHRPSTVQCDGLCLGPQNAAHHTMCVTSLRPRS